MKKLIKNLSPYIGIICLLINLVIVWLYFQPRYSPFALKAKNENIANGIQVWKFWDSKNWIAMYDRCLTGEEIRQFINHPTLAEKKDTVYIIWDRDSGPHYSLDSSDIWIQGDY